MRPCAAWAEGKTATAGSTRRQTQSAGAPGLGLEGDHFKKLAKKCSSFNPKGITIIDNQSQKISVIVQWQET